MAVELWAIFDIQIGITMATFRVKLENSTLEGLQKSLKTRQHSYQ